MPTLPGNGQGLVAECSTCVPPGSTTHCPPRLMCVRRPETSLDGTRGVDLPQLAARRPPTPTSPTTCPLSPAPPARPPGIPGHRRPGPRRPDRVPAAVVTALLDDEAASERRWPPRKSSGTRPAPRAGATSATSPARRRHRLGLRQPVGVGGTARPDRPDHRRHQRGLLRGRRARAGLLHVLAAAQGEAVSTFAERYVARYPAPPPTTALTRRARRPAHATLPFPAGGIET